MSDEIADDDHLFVCGACGKTSTTRYGFDGTASAGWDASCMTNAGKYPKTWLQWNASQTRVVAVRDPARIATGDPVDTVPA